MKLELRAWISTLLLCSRRPSPSFGKSSFRLLSTPFDSLIPPLCTKMSSSSSTPSVKAISLPYIDIQPDFASVLRDVSQSVIRAEEFWVSGYWEGKKSVHGKVSFHRVVLVPEKHTEAREEGEREKRSSSPSPFSFFLLISQVHCSMDEDGDLKTTTSGGVVLGPIGEDSSVSLRSSLLVRKGRRGRRELPRFSLASSLLSPFFLLIYRLLSRFPSPRSEFLRQLFDNLVKPSDLRRPLL